MTIQCPYTIWELQFAALGVEDKLTDDLREKLNAIEINPEDRMKNAAEFNGITLELLINSPNMNALLELYNAHNAGKFIQVCTECGLTTKEAWALLIAATNPSLFD